MREQLWNAQTQYERRHGICQDRGEIEGYSSCDGKGLAVAVKLCAESDCVQDVRPRIERTLHD